MALQTLVRGALNVLIVVTVFRLLTETHATVGVLTGAIGAGGLLGAVGALTLAGRRLAAPFGISLVFWGAPIALIALLPSEAAALGSCSWSVRPTASKTSPASRSSSESSTIAS